MNITTFELVKIATISTIEIEDDHTTFSIFQNLIILLDQELKTNICNERLAKIVKKEKTAIIRAKRKESTLLSRFFEFESIKNRITTYTFKPFSFLLFISNIKQEDKRVLEIIKSFKEGTLTINGNPLNYYQNDLFFEEVELVNEKEETAPAKQEEIKQEVKKLSKEEKKALTEKLKKFYDANPSFKQENTTYFISSVKICETLILSGFTFEQIQEETLRNGKSFAYSKAVLTSNNNKVETKKQNEVVKINNNIFEDIF